MSDTARSLSGMYRTLECSICLDIYNPPDKVPKNLTCGHTFCSNCLGNIQQSSMITCSKCRQKTPLSQGKVDELVTNFAIIEMLETTCENCRVQQWVERCDHCLKRLCEACNKSHSEEEWKNMKEDLIYAKKSVESMNGSYLSNAIFEEIDSQQKVAEGDVRNFWDDMHTKIDMRKDEDIEKVRHHFQDGHKRGRDWQNTFKTTLIKADSTIAGCLDRMETNEASKTSGSKQDTLRQEYKDALLNVNQTLTQMPTMEFLQLNISMGEKMFECMLANGIVNLCDTKNHEKTRFMPYEVKMVSNTNGNTKHRDKPDYKLATYSQSYGPQGSGPGTFDHPIDIVTSPVTGNVVISEYWGHRVHYLTSNLQPLSVYGGQGSGDKQLYYPKGVAVSNKGKVYITDRNNHRIHMTDENGKCLSVITSGRFNYPSGIAVDNNGLLYVCDSGHYNIQVLKEDGSSVRKFGSQGTNPGQFEYKPSFIAVSSDGKLVVSDCNKNIYILTTQGQHIRTITAKQSAGFTDPKGVAIDPHGSIIVADGAGYLVVMTEEGQVICQIGTAGSGPGQLQSPRGVTLTADGDILVCDFDNHRINKFSVPRVKF